MSKRINATLYTERKIVYSRKDRKHYFIEDPNGYLYSGGVYPTKILPEDLPEWFVHGYMGGGRHGYLSAKGVKHLVYDPDYFFENHLHKDDFLYISYKDEIVQNEGDSGFKWYTGYDTATCWHVIVDFVEAAEKYSGYDVTEIRKEIERKKEWYYEHNPEPCR
jgi:hypothetical protein